VIGCMFYAYTAVTHLTQPARYSGAGGWASSTECTPVGSIEGELQCHTEGKRSAWVCRLYPIT
jgi:hypothetical protein